MVSMFDSSAVDRGFKSRSGHTTVYKIGICSFSAKNAPLRRQAGWLGIRIMCPSGATYLTAGCCFNELALATSNSECRSHNKFILRETEVVCIILAVLKRVPAITYTLDSPLGHHQT
jgi:hypothetical protein